MATPEQPNYIHQCQLCKAIPEQIIDGKTKQGPWAHMCSSCHAEHGVGLGTGRGQKYDNLTGQKIAG